jgi:hypothetical protein
MRAVNQTTTNRAEGCCNFIACNAIASHAVGPRIPAHPYITATFHSFTQPMAFSNSHAEM